MPSLETCAGSGPQADAAEVVLPDGTKARPIHRIQPVEIALHSVSGTSYGTGSLTFIAERDLDPDGHLRPTNNRQAHPRHRLATKH